jgi:hypothetical protein
MPKNNRIFTVNVRGDCKDLAINRGFHAYYANGITAIEIESNSKKEAASKIINLGFEKLGYTILCCFE